MSRSHIEPKSLSLLIVLASLLAAPQTPRAGPAASAAPHHSFTIGTNDFLLDGRRFQIRCGEIHAPRVPSEYWRHRLQLARAMGLNTVCAYLFWNLHEPRPGAFDWTGQADAAEFCRIAQQEGLWVILRPGPYACAEWEMGGFPWWLLRHDDIQLRTRDPHYMNAATAYLKEVGRVLRPLQVMYGGPLIMVQVENEYGFYGKDPAYMGQLRQALLDAGFKVPLFACNPPHALKNGYRDDLFPVVNFGSDPAGGFKALREILPQGPLMCGEFYPGWFDTWGSPHHRGKPDQYLADLEYMLTHNASFSIYMVHGGTTFGFWTGADRPFKPDTSSYDYDAPISEAGWTTDKFVRTRDLFAKYLLPGETIPAPPARKPVMAIPPIEVREYAPLFENLPESVESGQVCTFERSGQPFGCMLYRTTIPAGPPALLEAKAINDFGQVFLNGERVGFTDRRAGNYKVRLSERKKAATLDILVEAMGRVNFGPEVHDHKGITGPVSLGSQALTRWSLYHLPLDLRMLEGLKYTSASANGPAFYRAQVMINEPADTFLDMRPWGKGVVWVNGHNLGRFWNIGPQQTMYLPGPWLKPGTNEIVVLDLLGPQKPVVASRDKPILDQLRPELDFAHIRRHQVKLNLDSHAPLHMGAFPAGVAAQEVKFAFLATGKYFCLESLSAHDGGPFAAIAELDLLDATGKPIGHDDWTIAFVDSEERAGEDGTAENAVDGQTANFWHTEWKLANPDHPHRLILHLGKPTSVSGFRYVPRQGEGGGRIKNYNVFVGDDLVQDPP
jgi:beta-galactosidase